MKTYCEGSSIYEFHVDDRAAALEWEASKNKMRVINNKIRESKLSGYNGQQTLPLNKQPSTFSFT
jgi:hypothetical protein